MAILSKDQILGAPDLQRETVPVPEWGEGAEVIISEMSGEAADDWAAETYTVDGDGEDAKVKVNRKNFQARAVAACLVDEAGNRLFTTEEVAKLGRKSGKVLGRLFSVADRLNGLTPKSRKALEKN